MTPPTYDDGVTTYEVPRSLSPSRVEAFTSCPMLFRFVSIEKIDDPPSIHTTRGSLVHRALQLAFTHPAAERTPTRFAASVEQAIAEYRDLPDLIRLGLPDDQAEQLFTECRQLVDNYQRMEDPRAVHAIGLLEGDLAEGLQAIQGRYPALDLGSYPFYRATGGGVALVAKGTDAAALDACVAEVTALVAALGKEPVAGEPPT